MQLTIELQGTPKRRYWERHNQLMSSPAELLQNLKGQWLRVVGSIPELIQIFDEDDRLVARYWEGWLIATSPTDERDLHNLNLANLNIPNEGYFAFDPGYFVLDVEMADRILANGIKYYGVPFLYDFDLDWVDRILREEVGPCK